MNKYKIFTSNYTDNIIKDIKFYVLHTYKSITKIETLDLCHLLGKIEEQDKEIKRLWKRNEEVYKEVRDYAYCLYATSEEKVIARRIIEHLATYLLFNTPIRKSDNNER